MALAAMMGQGAQAQALEKSAGDTKDEKQDHRLSPVLFGRKTRRTRGTNAMVVETAAADPIQSRLRETLIIGIGQGFFQKNQAAMARPITTTKARSTGCGTRREKRAEE